MTPERIVLISFQSPPSGHSVLSSPSARLSTTTVTGREGFCGTDSTVLLSVTLPLGGMGRRRILKAVFPTWNTQCVVSHF